MRENSASERHTPRQNRLLAALPAAVYRRLLPRFQLVALPAGKILVRPDDNLRCVYFPVAGIVALSYGIERRVASVKSWPVGNEGVIGISAFLGAPIRSERADVLIAGSAYGLDAAALRAEFRQGGAVQQLLLRYVQALITEVSQLGACGHYHTLDEQLCGFLLRAFDQVPAGELAITQESIAQLLGVRRVGVSGAARVLQAAGIIGYVRGRIRLLNRRKLVARACACHAVIEREFGRLRPR